MGAAQPHLAKGPAKYLHNKATIISAIGFETHKEV
jgi:hypothetical protein